MLPHADQTPGYQAALHEAIVAAEHRANIVRFHWITAIGLALWIALIGADALMAWVVVPGPLAWYAAIRAIGAPVLLYANRRSAESRVPTPGEFRFLDALTFLTIAWGVSAMCIYAGGLESIYVAGLTCVIVGRGIALAQPWRDAVPINAAILLGHPVILAIGALFRPELAVQWRDPASLATLFVGLSLVASSTLIVVWGADGHWAMRREVLRSRSIGRYQLHEKLGAGGMGEVWRARALGLKQDVALKLLPASRLGDSGAIQRFEREVEALSALHHPNTVRVFDYGVTEEGLSYYAMELLHGRDLARMVAADGPLRPGDAVAVTRQVASALGEAHAKGIVHRDVKPHNIMLVNAGAGVAHAKILDFGIARTEASGQATQAGFVVGTPAYLSPEAASGRPVDARADVYALGCTLFFALTGTTPFQGDVAALLDAHRSARPPRIAERTGVDVSAALEAVMACCLAKDPRERYVDGAALAEALALVTEAGSAARAPEGGQEQPSAETIQLEPDADREPA